MLHNAILTNDHGAVQNIMNRDSGLAATEKNFLGQSALHLGVINQEMIRSLISMAFGPNKSVDIPDNHGITPLIYAAAYGQLESTKALLQAGADAWLPDRLRCLSMWHCAMFCNEPGFVEEIIKFCDSTIHPNRTMSARDFCCWLRVINRPAAWQDPKGVTLSWIVNSGLISEHITALGNTILHLCNNPDEAQILLGRSWTTINNQNKRGHTALMIFARFRNPHILQLALTRSSDISPVDDYGMNALHHLNDQFRFRSHPSHHCDSWTMWMNSVIVLISEGIDVSQVDECTCPCTSLGCSPIRSFFWNDSGSKSSLKWLLGQIPWLLELALRLRLRSFEDLKIATVDCYRLLRFYESGLIHTCALHQEHHSFGSRPALHFCSPQED